MILIDKERFEKHIDIKDSKKKLNEWYKAVMIEQIERRYNLKGQPKTDTSKGLTDIYNKNKDYIIDHIIPFLSGNNDTIDSNLINMLLADDFIGGLAKEVELSPVKNLTGEWLKIMGYFSLSKFVFYNLSKIEEDIIKSIETKSLNNKQCIDILVNKYTSEIKKFNSIQDCINIALEEITFCKLDANKKNKIIQKKLVKNTIKQVKEKIFIKSIKGREFYKNSSGKIFEIHNINKFNKMIGFFLTYDMLNEKYRHVILNALDVQVCPYCNRQYITSYESTNLEKNNIDQLATADLDHFYPKSEFQLFSLSLYNFVPSCQICNSRMKINKPIEILYPYYEGFDNNVKFNIKAIDVEDEGKTLLDLLYGKQDCFNPSKFKLSIEYYGLTDDIKKKHVEGSIKMFKLEQVYQSHKRYAAELMRTRALYDNEINDTILNIINSNSEHNNRDDFIKENTLLKRILSHSEDDRLLELSKGEKDRILYGINSNDVEDNTKKPLMKLTRDILSF